MIFIFYYIHNNLNNLHIIVFYHEAERVVVDTTCVVAKVEYTCISGIVIVTAAHQPNRNNEIFKAFPIKN